MFKHQNNLNILRFTIILKDDPLSAVDANVANLLYKNCINGYLKYKIRVMVTHQVQHLKDANQIIVLKNGQIELKGTHDDVAQSVNIDNLLEECKDRKRKESINNETSLNESLFNSSSTINKLEFEKENLLKISSSQVLSINESKLAFNEIVMFSFKLCFILSFGLLYLKK